LTPSAKIKRPALTLVNGVVYIAVASHCDLGRITGWVIGYDATNLTRVVVYNNTPQRYNGGIWMSGEGISADTNGQPVSAPIGNGSVGLQRQSPRHDQSRRKFFKADAQWRHPQRHELVHALELSRSGKTATLISGQRAFS